MTWIEAILLGIIQGLTEFLPVSSSGHLEIGKVLLGTEVEASLAFTIVVHGATVCSTIVVFRKELATLIAGLFSFRMNESLKYVLKILVSCIPVAIAGLLFKEQVEQLFTGNMLFVGSMLLITATLLVITHNIKSNDKDIGFLHAFIIGIAQAIAVLPGISRSGATICTGLFLGNKREEVAKFSFLMVLLPIIGINFLDIISGDMTGTGNTALLPLILGFFSAFLTGWAACKLMIAIVKRSKLVWFGAYCYLVGIIAILWAIL